MFCSTNLVRFGAECTLGSDCRGGSRHHWVHLVSRLLGIDGRKAEAMLKRCLRKSGSQSYSLLVALSSYGDHSIKRHTSRRATILDSRGRPDLQRSMHFVDYRAMIDKRSPRSSSFVEGVGNCLRPHVSIISLPDLDPLCLPSSFRASPASLARIAPSDERESDGKTCSRRYLKHLPSDYACTHPSLPYV